MIVFKLTLNDHVGYVVGRDDLETVMEDVKYLDVGDALKIVVEEMSKQEFDELPEFGGW